MTVGIVGLGLIGGSLAKAYHAHGQRVLAMDSNLSVAEFARISGVIDGYLTDENMAECDLVLIAAGFVGCESYVADAFGVDLTARGTVADNHYTTNVPGVFACGDMRRGQSLVVWALREGRDTAAVVDNSLMGYTNL